MIDPQGEFSEKIELNGHIAHHERNGIYKVEEPYMVDIDEWSLDEENENYSAVGTKYSPEYDKCEIVYLSKDYNEIRDLANQLNDGGGNLYGCLHCIYNDNNRPIIAGGVYIGV